MNDRFLFRAKRMDNGEWAEGFLVKKHGLFFIYDIINSDTCRQPNYDVDPSTICQCTGLKDRNGLLIWENDICDRKEPYPEIVTYTKGDWTLDYSYVTGRERGSCYCNLGFYTNERMSVSVMGNIFDNPELMN